ncbi:glycosyltransferase family 4 protein [Paracoccus sp. Z118]|uniref:glycosyltransferase family 4 protein n=1 Tax=Paracoccus sp. Z118 TaxID=2851017 RepID=UPI001C2C6C06|nr:glycosyltransferase family 4 protein [Paracoccus sp. Z118]MBV0892824.1 glycosyltransferase family 4 protein [Paracoccus sp. Z118]
MTRTVVLATDSPAPSGVGRHMLTLAAALPDGWRARLAFPRHVEGRALAAEAMARGLEALTVPDGDWRPALSDADLIHVHAGIGWEGHGLVAMAGAPVVRTEHLPWLITCARQRADYARMVARTDAVIAVSRASAESWRPVLATMPRPRLPLACIPNGIADPLAAPALSPVRNILRGSGGGKPPVAAPQIILCVARFTPQKNHRTLIAAMARLKHTHPQARLQLVGTGPEEDRIRARAARHRLAVEFMGIRDDVPALMAEADLLVLPSAFEGLPLVVLEAMAARLPVIATNIGGVTEALGDDHPWLVSPGDARALAIALGRALDAPDARASLAATQRARFEAFHTATRMGEDTARIYAAVLRGQQRTNLNEQDPAWLHRRGGHRPPAFRRSGTDARRPDRRDCRP